MKNCAKFIFRFSLAGVLFTAALAFSREKTDEQQPVTNAPVRKSSGTGRIAGGNVLSDDQIAAFLTEWTDAKTQAKLVFQASFGMRSVSPEEKPKYVKSGKIPVRLSCILSEIKEVDGKKLAKRTSGTARFYILDPDGNIIIKKSLSLDKMCAS